ncbi:glycoside hydrolase family 5 protein [Flavobacterium sp. SUN052]|uniref:glycoside hydrolase family 5 protein n=1 Tax=Flavobacterium sp. SUN052 TaxID=3002441 RepID=UPI00237E7759|nr:glycoside hydrolase family 5 protein [Flavobacterium sp. SUN052]MEC4005477.1 glycoside hydrolase family 5 protein [Flavobacterium sp. SUN052]
MKKFLLILLFTTAFASAQVVKNNGNLQVIKTQLCNQKGNPIALHGMSYGWSCFHPSFYNKQTVKWLKKDWNCTVIRAAMGIEPDNGYLQNPKASEKLITDVVDAAIANDIYVIIDWHSHNLNTKEAIDFFDRISKKYNKFPNVIYEIVNEPDQESWEEVKAYSEEIIATIRKNDPDNIILVGSPHWDQDVNLPAENPIKNVTNVMYTMHFYAGTHKQWLRDRTDEAIKKGLPIFVSESAGMEASGDAAMDYVEWQKFIDWMNSNKLSWITWSVSDKEETCSVLKKGAASTGNWKSSDLKESGIKTRDYLKLYNEDGTLKSTSK